MKKYRIRYEYTTGDSFGTHEDDGILEASWNNLDTAKLALQRIQEHYKWYSSKESSYQKKVEQPKWWNCKYRAYDRAYRHNFINLPLDNNEEFQMWPPWCGYFESLTAVEIIEDKTDMRIEF